MKINVLGALAIPVGNRVTVRWFCKTTKGMLGGKHEERHEMLPQIEDLTTGVVYAFDWIYDAIGIGNDGEANPSRTFPVLYGETLSTGVAEDHSVTGVVAACRIITSIETGHLSGTGTPSTELSIEPEGGYRT